MKIHLTAELEQMVQHKMAAGHYASASEVVGEALRLLDERDQVLDLHKDEIRRKITAGMDSLRAGRGCDGEAVFERLAIELDANDGHEAA